MMMATLDLSSLTNDGDTVELPDGRTLRLCIEPDGIDPFEDNPEYYGQIASDAGPWDRDGQRTNGRPSSFDGNSEKLWLLPNGGPVWWQPPKDVKRSDPSFREFRSFIIELASFGSHYIRLEVLEGKDAYGAPIVVNFAGMGGVDSLDSDYLSQVISDLASELDL